VKGNFGLRYGFVDAWLWVSAHVDQHLLVFRRRQHVIARWWYMSGLCLLLMVDEVLWYHTLAHLASPMSVVYRILNKLFNFYSYNILLSSRTVPRQSP